MSLYASTVTLSATSGFVSKTRLRELGPVFIDEVNETFSRGVRFVIRWPSVRSTAPGLMRSLA